MEMKVKGRKGGDDVEENGNGVKKMKMMWRMMEMEVRKMKITKRMGN